MCMCMYVDLCVAGEKEDDRLNKGIGKGMIFGCNNIILQ